MELSELNDAEYLDEMGLAVGNDIAWAEFVTDDVLGRTMDALEMLSASLASQVIRHGNAPGADLDWVHRTQGMQRLVSARMKQVRRKLGVDGPVMKGSFQAREKLWKQFAHEVCELVEDSDAAENLAEVQVPFGGINAQEWVSRRRVKRGLDADWSGTKTTETLGRSVQEWEKRLQDALRFAEELAGALEEVDPAALLDITIGDINAVEWLNIRADRRAAA